MPCITAVKSRAAAAMASLRTMNRRGKVVGKAAGGNQRLTDGE
jgi:hypothetical protein